MFLYEIEEVVEGQARTFQATINTKKDLLISELQSWLSNEKKYFVGSTHQKNVAYSRKRTV